MDLQEAAIGNYLREGPTRVGEYSMVRISRIKVHPVISQLFPIKAEVLSAIQASMTSFCFNPAYPVVLARGPWTGGGNVVVDGHTRLQAAKAAKLEHIPAVRLTFDTVDDALDYAISSQRNRRNITDADILQCVAVLDEKRKKGGDRKSDEAKSKAPSGAIDPQPARSSESTAKLLGTSSRKVERARTVLNHADEETKREIAEGKKSINKGYQETQAKRPKRHAGPPIDEVPTTDERLTPRLPTAEEIVRDCPIRFSDVSAETDIKTLEESGLFSSGSTALENSMFTVVETYVTMAISCMDKMDKELDDPNFLSAIDRIENRCKELAALHEGQSHAKPMYHVLHDPADVAGMVLDKFSPAECLEIAGRLASAHGHVIVEDGPEHLETSGTGRGAREQDAEQQSLAISS